MGSRDVIGHVTIRLPGVDFLSVVHGDHGTVTEIWRFKYWTYEPGHRTKDGRMERERERGRERESGKEMEGKGEGKGEVDEK